MIGLTSAGNVAFTAGLGIYDAVIAYDDIKTLDRTPSVYVDMSGDTNILAAVHHHLGEEVRASLKVGATHWEVLRADAALPGAKPAFFFAPAQVAKRDAEWGEGEVLRRADAANLTFVRTLGDAIRISVDHGAEAITKRYADMLANRVPPAEGLILSFGNAA